MRAFPVAAGGVVDEWNRLAIGVSAPRAKRGDQILRLVVFAAEVKDAAFDGRIYSGGHCDSVEREVSD